MKVIECLCNVSRAASLREIDQRQNSSEALVQKANCCIYSRSPSHVSTSAEQEDCRVDDMKKSCTASAKCCFLLFLLIIKQNEHPTCSQDFVGTGCENCQQCLTAAAAAALTVNVPQSTLTECSACTFCFMTHVDISALEKKNPALV